jgi:non-ribosomal peptide synthetase component F
MSPSEATQPGQALRLVVTRGICGLRSSLTAEVAVSHLCEQAAGGDACVLGRALPNVRVYVLDGQPPDVPVEVTRKVQIAGVGLGVAV